jgi:hypothetical protein
MQSPYKEEFIYEVVEIWVEFWRWQSKVTEKKWQYVIGFVFNWSRCTLSLRYFRKIHVKARDFSKVILYELLILRKSTQSSHHLKWASCHHDMAHSFLADTGNYRMRMGAGRVLNEQWQTAYRG